ncbi:MAG: hypothetical protein ACRDJ9_29685, partial [Dehalococcoidia bacterium]
MHHDLFDDVARMFMIVGSRRKALHFLGAGLISGWTARHDAVTAPKRRCQKLAKPCSKRKPCCRGTKCVRGRCRCPASKKTCGQRCIARRACCPGSEEACGGACVPKGTCCSSQQQRCGNQCIPR